MAVTVLSLVIAGVGAAAKVLQQVGYKPGDLLKLAEPVIKDVSKKIPDYQRSVSEYHNAAELSGWMVEHKYLYTSMYRYYDLNGHELLELQRTVYEYFTTLKNVTVKKAFQDATATVICKANLPRSAAGLKLNLTVTLTQEGNAAKVTYDSPTNEVIESIIGLAGSFFIIGGAKLLGQAIRHDIPLELDKSIKELLASPEKLPEKTQVLSEEEILAKTVEAELQFQHGRDYYTGDGATQDYSKAREYFEKAAEYGHVEAQVFLGKCYYLGKGGSYDFHRAVQWFYQASYNNSAEGSYWLSKCYELGLGLPKDPAWAQHYYKLALEQGLDTSSVVQ